MARIRQTAVTDPTTGKPLPNGVIYRGPLQWKVAMRHVLSSVTAKILSTKPTQEDAGAPEQPARLDLLGGGRPTGRAVVRDETVLPRPPERADNRIGAADNAGGGPDCLVEDRLRVA